MTEEQLCSFEITSIAECMQSQARLLWDLLGNLLSADPKLVGKRKRYWKHTQAKDTIQNQQQSVAANGDIEMADIEGLNDKTSTSNEEEEEYWRLLEPGIPPLSDDEDKPEDFLENMEQQFNTLINIKKVVCLSIMLQSTNL
ncbi:hypothetical protein B0H34DRAFT_679958 [Crassisporium funariophilum]|nr:hypothetical protein B0H34DRAFT_679958 [Crassisporium funariophilum]